MLDKFRQNSRNIVIYVLFGILIAVFIISFGPQSGQQSSGCMPRSQFAVRVDGVDVADSSWRFAMVAMNLTKSGPRARGSRALETVMDGLIERELLAQAAAKAGFTLSQKEVESRIATGEMYVLGQRWPGELIYFNEGVFDYDRLELYARSLNLPNVAAFVGEQRKEMLAQKMRELISASVRVSPEEVLDRYQRESTHVSIEYVKFQPRLYKRTLEMSDAEVDAYIAAHDEDLKKQFEADKNLYAGAGKWVQIRHIFIKSERKQAAEADPDSALPAADAGPADAKKEELPDPARAVAEGALSRLKAGDDFAKVAKDVSQDERSAARGGLQEWRRATAVGWGTEVTDAVDKLKPGETTAVVESARGYHIVKLEAVSEGGPSYDLLKKDLGWEAAREQKSKDLAKADADAALEKAKAGAALDTLFAKGSPDQDDVDEEAPAPEAPPEPAPAPAGGPGAPRGTPPAPPAPAPAKLAVPAPKLLDSGPITRSGAIVAGMGGERYVGKSADLAKAVFESVAKGQLAPQVYEVEDGYVIFRVTDKVEPDMDEFEKQKAEMASQMASEKGFGLVASWANRRCTETKAAGEISINSFYIEYDDVDEKTGQRRKTNYQPCTGGGGDVGMGGLPPGIMLQ